MASNAALRATMDSVNPCCALWQARYLKMEKKRNALREGVKILKDRVDGLQQKNLDLEKERDRANAIEEEKQKEASLRISMKSEMYPTTCEVDSSNEELYKEVAHLQKFLSDRQVEIDNLQQLLTEERRRIDVEKKRADSERHKAAELQEALESEKRRFDEVRKMNDAMEKEIAALKSEKLASVPRAESKVEDYNKEIAPLQACISERELEIDRLQRLLAEEERKADAERCCADLERRKSAELQEALGREKSRADEVIKMADAAGKSAEENRIQMEALKVEIDKIRLKFEEAKRKVEVEKQKAIKEKNRADEEKVRLLEQRKIAETNEKKMTEEKLRANNLLRQLEEKQQNLENLQKALQEIKSSQRSMYSSELDEIKRELDAERKKYAREKKRADDEMSKREEYKKVAEENTKSAAQEKLRVEKLTQELQSSQQRVEYLEKQLHEMNDILEAETKKVCKVEKRADLEKLKSDEQERIAAQNVRMASEEKSRADNLHRELENNRKKLQDAENELRELKSHLKLGAASNAPPVVNDQISEVQFLQKQLKFEKQRVKHAKEVAELEKDRNSLVQIELFRLRQGVKSLWCQLDALTDIGVKNGANILSKKSGLSDVDTGLFSCRGFPSQMYLCGDAEFRMSSLSSRDASCHIKEREGFLPPMHCMESPAGMETELDTLTGGSHGETLRSSALNLNTASFSDEQLVGSQERVAHSLTKQAALAAEKTDLQATTAKCSDGCHKQKVSERVGIVAEDSVKSPLKATAGGAIKKRKILDELENIKSMQSEGKWIFHDAERKMSALQSTLILPMIKQMEKDPYDLPVCLVSSYNSYDRSRKKRKASDDLEAACLQIGDFNVQEDLGRHEVALTISKRHENSEVFQDASTDVVKCNQDVKGFERLMNGDYMKLLNLDNAVDEECFRLAMERPLSPTLPEIDLCDSETRIDAQMLSVQASKACEAGAQRGGLGHNDRQLYCVVFSDMENSNSINRIFCAVRACVAQSFLLDTKNWLVHDILAALQLEIHMRPREKVCAFFSLILLNFAGASRRSKDIQDRELLNSFCAHIRSVLSGLETRSLFAEICPLNDLISLFEDFVLSRRILLQSNATSGTLSDSSSSFEVLHEGRKYVLSPRVASIHLVIAGSIALCSIGTAVGRIGYICEVSFNILRMCGTVDQLMLRILHIFAHVCGQEYLSSSSHSFMKVVKSVITQIEHTSANIACTDLQSANDGEACFLPCGRCPFSEGSVSFDDLSAMLLEELHCYCLESSVPQGPGGQVHLSTDSLFRNVCDVLSSLELVASKMGWNWAWNKIVPKLLKILESCDPGRGSSTALVALLGELGRLGIKECGYDDVGVESIKCQLANTLVCYGGSSKCTAFAMALVSALVRLHPKGHKDFDNKNREPLPKIDGHAAYEILRNYVSWLSRDELSLLLGHENSLVV